MTNSFSYCGDTYYIGSKILVNYENNVKVEAIVRFGEYSYDDDGYERHNIGMFVEYITSHGMEILEFCDFVDYLKAWNLDYTVYMPEIL